MDARYALIFLVGAWATCIAYLCLSPPSNPFVALILLTGLIMSTSLLLLGVYVEYRFRDFP